LRQEGRSGGQAVCTAVPTPTPGPQLSARPPDRLTALSPASRPPTARADEAAGLWHDARVAVRTAALDRGRVHGRLQLDGLAWRGGHGTSSFSAFLRVCLANISRPIEPATTQLTHYRQIS